MTWLDRILRRKRLYGELSEEIRAHLDEKVEELVAGGMAREEAEHAARREFGNVMLTEERGRDEWRWAGLEDFLIDVRYALRMLRKSPGFTAVAIITLALGIGANTAVFSLVDALFLRAWPVRDPARLVVISTIPHKKTGFDFCSYPDYLDIRNGTTAFSGILAYGKRGGIVSGGIRGEGVTVDVVSENYFSVLGLRPALGRFFFLRPGEQNANRQAVVLSYALWQRHFGADPALPGKTIVLDDKSFTVLGIAPKEFRGLDKGSPTDLWVTPGGWVTMLPANVNDFTTRPDRWLDVVARLKPNAGLRQARAELGTLAARLAIAHPAADKDIRFRVTPASEREHAGLDSGLFLMAMVGLVLLIACSNVANLLLAQTERRQKEIAVRQALGADRRHLVAHLLTESLVLAGIGGALGLLLAWWLLGLLPLLLQLPPIQAAGHAGLDLRALVFTTAVSLLTAILFGLAPGLESSKVDLVPLLKGEEPRLARFSRRLSLRSVLVTAEIALSVVLLISSGLLLRSFLFSEHINPGFDQNRNVLMLSMGPPMLYGYSESRAAALYPALVQRIEAVPGVVRASYGRRPPLTEEESGEMAPVALPGTASPKNEWQRVRYNIVSTDYFRTFGTRVLRGRDFHRSDTPDAQRVVIVNQMLARELWPGKDAVGQHLQIGSKDFKVAGVVENGKYTNLHEAAEPYLFFPFSQEFSFEASLFVQTAGDPRAMVSGVLAAARSVGGNVPIVDTTTLANYMSTLLGGERASAALLVGLSVLGMFLAAVGLYGVVAYLVSHRTHEIGLRMALGARPVDVLKLSLSQGIRLAGLGAAIGLVAAVATSHLMANRLYGVEPTDPLTYLAGAGIAVAIALLACWIPARRAMRVDPVAALRNE